jgi:hypothetical protein
MKPAIIDKISHFPISIDFESDFSSGR